MGQRCLTNRRAHTGAARSSPRRIREEVCAGGYGDDTGPREVRDEVHVGVQHVG